MSGNQAADDGYPPMPLDGDYDQIKRYANVMLIAEVLRGYDEALIGHDTDTPAERWARAEQECDRIHAERANAPAILGGDDA